MKQVLLSSGSRKRVTWIDEDPHIQPNNIIRFKNESRDWTIEAVYEPSIDKGNINRTWHVGGL